MSKIHISKMDEVFFSIRADPGIRLEIQDYFSFFVEGYKFHPLFKAKRWDGKIRLFDLNRSRLYIGLFYEFFKFCDERGYRIIFEEENASTRHHYGTLKETVTPDEVTPEDAKILDSIPCKYGSPRDYQMEAIFKGIKEKRKAMVLATGAGKSLIIYYLSLWHVQKYSSPVLIVVPSTNLVEQMFSDFHDYAKGSIPDNFIHRIYSGKEKEHIDFSSSPIVISTWQSLIALRNKDSLRSYGCVILDEAHLCEGVSIKSILENCTNASYRFGFTGTLKGTKVNEMQLTGLLGPINRIIHTHELQQRGQLAGLDIECITLKYPEIYGKELLGNSKKNPEYQREVDLILSSEKRNRFICQLALEQKGNTLILFHMVEKQGKRLFDIAKEMNSAMGECKNIFYISGEIKIDEREQIRNTVEKEKKGNLILATDSLFSTGVNLRNLHNIIFAFSTKSQVRVIQSIGRGLRIADNGQDTKVYDIVDHIGWKGRKNFVLIHAHKRIEYYINEKFRFKIRELTFNPF